MSIILGWEEEDRRELEVEEESFRKGRGWGNRDEGEGIGRKIVEFVIRWL